MPLAMQLRNIVSHILQSVVYVSFFSMINRLDLHFKMLKFAKYSSVEHCQLMWFAAA